MPEIPPNTPPSPTGNHEAVTFTLATAPGYAVYRKQLSGGLVRLAYLPSGTTTYTDTPPSMGAQSYTYYVTANDTCTNPGANRAPPRTGTPNARARRAAQGAGIERRLVPGLEVGLSARSPRKEEVMAADIRILFDGGEECKAFKPFGEIIQLDQVIDQN